MRLKHYCNLSGEPTEDARSYCTYSGDKAAASIAPCRRRAPSSSHTCSPAVVAVTVMAWPLAGAPRSRANDKVDLRLVRDADRSVPARHRPRLDRFATAVFTVGGGRGGGWPLAPAQDEGMLPFKFLVFLSGPQTYLGCPPLWCARRLGCGLPLAAGGGTM